LIDLKFGLKFSYKSNMMNFGNINDSQASADFTMQNTSSPGLGGHLRHKNVRASRDNSYEEGIGTY